MQGIIFLNLQKKIMDKIWRNRETELWRMLCIRLSFMLLLLAFSRWAIYLFNINSFPNITSSELFKLFFNGFRFDINTLIIYNSPLIILYCLPIRYKFNDLYKKIVDIIFVVANSIAVGLNLIDVIYFRYLDKRMCSELFTFFKGTDENQVGLMASFFVDFWYMFLLFFVLLFFIILIMKKTKVKNNTSQFNLIWHVKQSIVFVIVIGLSVIGIRGGFQLIPISILTVTNYTTKYAPLVINTPFSILYGSTSASLENISFFDDKEIEDLYTPIHTDLKSNRFITGETKGRNLVLIILEGVGQEMIGYYNTEYKKSLTPFLDSLLNESLTFDGMANGRRSIESLPSLMTGVPSLMATDYPSSKYASNSIDGLGSILKRHGYKTAFYHGGNNGTMNFYSTSKSNGFDDYYGRTEYNNDSDYDGAWGIYDIPFLQYSAEKMNEYKEPFAATLFLLSSHVPYSLPSDYTVPEYLSSNTAFEKTVRYSDDALSLFFKKISQYEWFDNTIFVIVSDHGNSEHHYNKYKNVKGAYKIPIAFYAPNIIEKRRVEEIAQQTDINLSILSLLEIDEDVFSFGRNLFDSISKPSYISFLNSIYQYSNGEYFMQSDGNDIQAVYDINDETLSNNLMKDNSNKFDSLNIEFKLRLQQYNNRMNRNKLYVLK
jgi:phosphoglycerol transferase MdoB-like AlkP superfamily enzyme